MATVVQDIKTALVTKLQNVSGLNGVYTYEVAKPDNGQYPFACIILNDFVGKFGDTIRNIREFKFTVNIYQERTATGFGNQKAERLMDEMIDEITTAFDADTTLSGMVKYIHPIGGNTNYVDREIGDTRIAQLEIVATVVVPSTT